MACSRAPSRGTRRPRTRSNKAAVHGSSQVSLGRWRRNRPTETDSMDFPYSPKVKELAARVAQFMAENVYPAEPRYAAEVEANRKRGNAWVPTKVMEELKAKARAAGLWNLFLPESDLGAGLTNLEYAPLCEV